MIDLVAPTSRNAGKTLRRGAVALLCVLAACGSIAADRDGAQEGAGPMPRLEQEILELRELLRALEARRGEELRELREQYERQIEELERRLDELESGTAGAASEADQLEALRGEAEAEAAAGKAKPEEEPERGASTGRQRALQALNPEISFLGNVSYDWSDTRIQDRFLLRAAEISFQSVLDPYTRFKAYLAAHQEPAELPASGAGDSEPAEEIAVNLEEAFMEWVALPLGSRLRVGRFRQQFGTLNRWHPHSLPSVDVPFALRNLFTDEGLIGLGVGFDLPIPHFWATANTLTLELVNPDNESAFAGAAFRDPGLLVRHTGFFDLGDDAYVEVNINGMIGPNADEGGRDTTLGGVDLNFVWEPVDKARYRGMELRGEYIRTRFDVEDGGTVESQSYYAYLTWKLSRRWTVGLRRDDAELPWDRFELAGGQTFREGLRERAWSPFLTFWQSEYVRLRLQYQHADRDFAFAFGPDDDDRLWIQATFAAGPHKHETY